MPKHKFNTPHRPQGHSDVSLVSHLPIWVSIGGIFLSFMAGYINVIGFLHAHALTHMTGLVSQLSISAADSDWQRVASLGLVIFFFFLGSLLSGFIVQQSNLQFGRRYGVVLILESILLFSAVPLLMANYEFGYYLAAMASGLQNAMATTYSGAIIRTTHLTGFITDFGVAVGHMLRGWKIDRLRFTLYGAVTVGFFGGGLAGTWVSNLISFQALYIPAGLVGLIGVGYVIFVQILRNTHRLI